MATPTIRELLARLEEQQARIERLESAAAAPAANPVAGKPAESSRGPAGLTRRGMAKAAAAGMAGLAGAMLVEPAGAASAATSGPASFTSSTKTPAVKASNTGQGNAITAFAQVGTVIHGQQNSAGSQAAGLRGTIKGKNGTGAGVVGASPAGPGVRGSSASGPGVEGSSGTGTGVTGSSGSTASGTAAVQGTITSTSPGGYSAGVLGVNNGTGGSGIGVYGSQNGYGWGVYGTTPSGSGVYGYSSSGFGVQAGSASGTAVYASSTGGIGVDAHAGTGTGVSGSSTSGTGVEGTSSNGYGVYASSPGNYAVVGVTTSGNGVYGQVSNAPQAGVVGRTLDASGNWAVYGFGNIGATGTKSALVTAADGTGHLTLYCMESPECWFEDFGSARLSGGSAAVRIDPGFAQTVHLGEYHVFLQAEGQCKGLIVEDKTAAGFTVRELGGGTSSVPFAYRIVARRKDVIAPRLNRVTLPHAPVHARVAAPVPARPKVPEQGR